MKKVLLALALIASANLMAQTENENVNTLKVSDTIVQTTVPADGYVKVDNTALPGKLSDALLAQYKDATIKEVFENKVTEMFRVIILSSEGKELSLTLNDKSKNTTEVPIDEPKTTEAPTQN